MATVLCHQRMAIRCPRVGRTARRLASSLAAAGLSPGRVATKHVGMWATCARGEEELVYTTCCREVVGR